MKEISPIASELKSIADSNNGLLRPVDVVEAARDERSHLHSWFQWDDTKAAHEFRLDQARKLIRVNVAFLASTNQAVPYRVFVSLPSDRLNDGGGYRETLTVIADSQMRQEMLDEALREARAWQARYQKLEELKEVFDAIGKVAVPA